MLLNDEGEWSILGPVESWNYNYRDLPSSDYSLSMQTVKTFYDNAHRPIVTNASSSSVSSSSASSGSEDSPSAAPVATSLPLPVYPPLFVVIPHVDPYPTSAQSTVFSSPHSVVPTPLYSVLINQFHSNSTHSPLPFSTFLFSPTLPNLVDVFAPSPFSVAIPSPLAAIIDLPSPTSPDFPSPLVDLFDFPSPSPTSHVTIDDFRSQRSPYRSIFLTPSLLATTDASNWSSPSNSPASSN